MVSAGLSGCDSLLGDGADTGNGEDPTGPFQESMSISAENGAVYVVGYAQVTRNDQDPVVEKRDADGNRVWQVRHDETPVDGRAVYVALDDQDRPYVAFTVDGGSNDGDRIQLNHVESGAFDDAPFDSYGPGGGGKVTIIARLDPTTGRIERGTFLRARQSSGNTNTLRPTGLSADDGSVQVGADSSAWPPAAGATQSNWQRFDPNRFNDATRPPLRYTLNADLTAITAVDIIE